MPKLFDYVTSINDNKKDIMKDDIDERGYSPFHTNRSLSYFNDTVGLANVVNQYLAQDMYQQVVLLDERDSTYSINVFKYINAHI